MGLVEKKTIFSALVFISGGVGVLLPWARGRRAPAERLMGWGNAFAGGVLGGAGLVHLLSGGADEFRALAPGLNYPLAFVLACGGFLLTLLIEAVIVPGSPDRGKSMLDICSGSSGHETGPQEMTIKPHPVFYALLACAVNSLQGRSVALFRRQRRAQPVCATHARISLGARDTKSIGNHIDARDPRYITRIPNWVTFPRKSLPIGTGL